MIFTTKADDTMNPVHGSSRCRSALALVAISLLASGSIVAQGSGDTLRLSVGDAEARFVEGNLQLLASRMGVEGARAAMLQAGLWSNPNIAIEQNVYNPATQRYFDFTRDGNSEVQVQQLIVLAGKRGKQVRLAEENTAVAEQSFLDLLRSLKQQLRTDMYDLYYLRRSVAFYDESLRALTSTITTATRMFEGRTLLLAELLRLKSLYFSLANERLGLVMQEEGIQQDLKILLRDTSARTAVYMPDIDTLRAGFQVITLDSARAVAAQYRPDLRVAASTVALDEANLSLQKALAVPDLTLAGRWSRNGSYIPDYFAVSVAIDLPLFNRNQGNILAAERTLDADRANLEATRMRVDRDVDLALKKAQESDRLLGSSSRAFTDQYATLVGGMIANYQKRYVSILEFTDFFESYRTSMMQMYQLQNNRLDAIEALNYAVGTDLVKP